VRLSQYDWHCDLAMVRNPDALAPLRVAAAVSLRGILHPTHRHKCATNLAGNKGTMVLQHLATKFASAGGHPTVLLFPIN
jgi:hypothetical protein